jgi:hypothetical protein
VRTIADHLGWVPDPGLASLVSRRWHRRQGSARCGFLHQADPARQTGWESERASIVVAGRQAGWTLVDLPCDGVGGPDLLDQARRHGVHGLICGLLHGDGACLEALWDAYPAVSMGRGSLQPPIPHVGSDLFTGYQRVWEALYAVGWRRIGIALPAWGDSLSVRLRRAALLERWYELDPADRIPLLTYPPDDPRTVLTWAVEHRPDIVLAFDPPRAEALREAGLQLPITCASIYDCAAQPAWAGNLKDGIAIAREALSLLTLQVRGGLVGCQLAGLSHQISMPFIDGGRLPRPEQRRA